MQVHVSGRCEAVEFSALMLKTRPDILDRLSHFAVPIKDDVEASLVATLHTQGLLPEEIRSNFVAELRLAAVREADSSFLHDSDLAAVLTEEEKDTILADVETNVLQRIDHHVNRLRDDWDSDYPPEHHFEDLEKSLERFANAVAHKADYQSALRLAYNTISEAVARMNETYEPASSTSAPIASSTPPSTALANLFRDVDE